MKSKIFLLHNIISPYRVPIFTSLDKKHDLLIYFTRQTSKDRLWKVSKDLDFHREVDRGRAFGPLVFAPKLAGHLLKNTYDVYVITDNDEDILCSLLVMLTAKMRRKKLAIWSGQVSKSKAALQLLETNPYYKPFYAAYKWAILTMRKMLWRQASAAITYSYATNEFLESVLPAGLELFTGTQVMPTNLLPPPKQELKKLDDYVILSLGYMRPEKNLDTLIAAFAMIKNPNTTLLIIGDGPDKARLQKLADGNAKIVFLPNKEGVEKAAYYMMADVFVLPTHYDPWGLVVNEAMYYDLPVIVSRAAGARALVRHGENGFLFDPKNASQLAGYIDQLSSVALRKKFVAQAAAEKQQATNISSVVDTFSRLFTYLER